MPQYRITTLGCRVNHAEAREIESVLRTRGLRPAAPNQPADLEVVHTCSVTHAAAAKSRNAIRRAARRLARNGGPGPERSAATAVPEVIITGCYTATHRDEAAGLAGSDANVVLHSVDDRTPMIERFALRVDEWLDRLPARNWVRSGADGCCSPSGGRRNSHDTGRATAPTVHPLPVIAQPTQRGRHIRAELRIQDGCDAHCTFCIIPKIRRTLRSKTIPDAVREARMLVDAGHPEIVLSGIFIGAYGHETALRRRQQHRHASPLADLLDAVAQVPGLQRLRISSMEPMDVTEPLLDAMLANAPTVVPHLHLPLQSGSDAILRRMNRQYRIGEYLDMIDRVNDALTLPPQQPGGDALPPAITTDIICGFPGETEADFEQTVAVAERVGYLHMHVFPYSPREGTAAARWTDRHIPHPIAKARVHRLIDLENDPHDGLSIRYRRRLLGRTVRTILEQPHRSRSGIMVGRCDHYALVGVPVSAEAASAGGPGRPGRGSVVQVRVTDVTAEETRGDPAPAAVGLPVVS